MISKITFTPQIFSAQNRNNAGTNANSFGSKKKLTKILNSEPVNSAVQNAFTKLSQNRFKNNLGTYMTTTKNADIFLRETKFGKQAELTLSNGIFQGGRSFMNFVIEKTAGKNAKITSADGSMPVKEAEKMVTTYLSDLK